MTKAYKIRNGDGLFSTGGTHPSWTKKGKTWGNLGSLRSHLTLLCEHWASRAYPHYWRKDTPLPAHPYDGCEILTLVLQPAATTPIEGELVERVDKAITKLSTGYYADDPDYQAAAKTLQAWKDAR